MTESMEGLGEVDEAGEATEPAPEPAPASPSEEPVPKATTEREIERKLRVPALFALPPITGERTGIARLTARPPFVHTASYFDTDDLRLARWGVTLRRREGGTDEGWHLKLPVAGGHRGDRDEVRLPLTAAESAPPTELVDIVTALVRGAPLRHVATLRTERTPYMLRDASGRVVAELVDDVVSVLDGDRVAGRFREIEVEAREGGAADIEPVVAVLIESGAEPGITSKAAHALGPRASAAPDVPLPHPVRPRDSAADALQAHLVTHARRLVLQDVRLRRDLPDSVHQVRVAARRLRSALRTFRPLLDVTWSDHLREELGWLAGELGMVRDTEVLQKRLDEHCALLDDPAAAAAASRVIDAALGERQARARAQALAAMRSPRYLALLDLLVTGVQSPPFTSMASRSAREVMPALSWRAWRRLRRDADDLEHDTAAEHWHRSRILAKRARYAAESLVPVFGDEAVVLAESLEQVTELLGEHQDAWVAQQTIRELAANPSLTGPEGWGLGLLVAVEVEAELASRAQFRRVWSQARRAHRRSSLR